MSLSSIGDTLLQTGKRLHQAGIEEYQLESEWILAAALDIPRLQIGLLRDQPMEALASERLENLITQRLKRLPLAYVLGEQPFFDLSLRVNPSVLIPRPETELLAEEAMRLLKHCSRAVVVDVGTGSGALALTLSRLPSIETIIGIDISADALRIAAQNEARLFPSPRIVWQQGDLLEDLLQASRRVDFVIANLPYIPSQDIPTLSAEVQAEPRLALDGGVDGLQIIRRLIPQAWSILQPNGHLLLEIGYDQGAAMNTLLHQDNRWHRIQINKDWAGYDRIVHAQKKEGRSWMS